MSDALTYTWSFPGGASGEEPACQRRRYKRLGFNPCVGMIPWRTAWQPTPVFLPGESHRQRRLVGYSPWGPKDSGMTGSYLAQHRTLTYIWCRPHAQPCGQQ